MLSFRYLTTHRYHKSVFLFAFALFLALICVLLLHLGVAHASGVYQASFSGSGTENSPRYTEYIYNHCSGAGYSAYVTRYLDGSNNYVYTLQADWRGDYGPWKSVCRSGRGCPNGTALSASGITSSVTLGGSYGRDAVYVRLNVDQSSYRRSGADLVISSCKGSLVLPADDVSYISNGHAYRQYVFPSQSPPTCSVTASINPIAYGATTTLSWTSNGATSLYINNIGYVTPTSGSVAVGPLATTAYNGSASGPGGSNQCNFTLLVNPPASCSFNGSIVNHGASTTAYSSSTVPYGSLCSSISQSRVCGNGVLTGSYAYPSCAVLDPPPSCSPATSYSCAGSNIVQTSTSSICAVTTNSSYATCASGSFCSEGLSSCVTAIPAGTITASPRIVNRGSPVRVTWSTTDTVSCSVTGNGDTFVGTSGSATTSAITKAVTYTLACDDADADTVQDDITGSVFILPIPGWRER